MSREPLIEDVSNQFQFNSDYCEGGRLISKAVSNFTLVTRSPSSQLLLSTNILRFYYILNCF